MYPDRMFETNNEYLSFLARQNVASAGVGNVYWVIKATETFYPQFLTDKQFKYSDGSSSVHTSLSSALSATVECRNDYVIVLPSNSDVDITAALALNKKSVHLLCPAGLGYDVGATNACRVHQNTASTALIAISDASVEVAGFYFKPYADASHITVAATSYGLNIHHNFFTLSWSSSPAAAILCAGDGGAWGIVSYRNIFQSMSGDNVTCASLITVGTSATGARCNYNTIIIGDGNILTIGIDNSAVKGETNFNTFSESGGASVGSGGTITNAFNIHATGCAIGNRAAVGTAQLCSGGTADHTFVDNIAGTSTSGTDHWNPES